MGSEDISERCVCTYVFNALIFLMHLYFNAHLFAQQSHIV